MPSNDFLPFGTAAGANVSTQSDWAALAARTAGFSAGVASSAQVNKALRQAGFVASAIAQFVADNQAGNVADDGVVANFEAQIKAAIQAIVTGLFTGSNQQKTAVGYQKLPGGLILQWGNGTSSGTGTSNLVFTMPMTFPTAFLGAALMTSGGNAIGSITGSSASGFAVTTYNAATAAIAGGLGMYYIAIGY